MTSYRRLRSRDLFPTDEPVPAASLIGRSADVEELTNALANGLNRIMVGPRRTGKTSVALAALAELRARGCYVVSTDLFRLSGTAELAEALARGLLTNRAPAHRAGAATRRASRSLVEAAGRVVSAKLSGEFGADIEITLTPGLAARDPQHYLAFALELCQQVADRDDHDVVVFIDEFQEIAGARAIFGDPDAVTKLMRSVLQNSPRVTVLFAGSIDHAMRELFTPEHRAFYRFGAFETLGVITADQWQAGISARLATDNTTIDPLALVTLVERGDGHPRSTMLLAQQAHSLSVLLGRRHIDGELALEAYTEALAADAGSHQSEVERIRELGKHTFEVARRLARGTAPYAGTSPRSTQRAVEMLVRAGVVEQVPGVGAHTTGRWRLVDPLLRTYLAALAP